MLLSTGKIFAGENPRLRKQKFQALQKFAVEMSESVKPFRDEMLEGMVVRIKGFFAAVMAKFALQRCRARGKALGFANVEGHETLTVHRVPMDN